MEEISIAESAKRVYAFVARWIFVILGGTFLATAVALGATFMVRDTYEAESVLTIASEAGLPRLNEASGEAWKASLRSPAVMKALVSYVCRAQAGAKKLPEEPSEDLMERLEEIPALEDREIEALRRMDPEDVKAIRDMPVDALRTSYERLFQMFHPRVLSPTEGAVRNPPYYIVHLAVWDHNPVRARVLANAWCQIFMEQYTGEIRRRRVEPYEEFAKRLELARGEYEQAHERYAHANASAKAEALRARLEAQKRALDYLMLERTKKSVELKDALSEGKTLTRRMEELDSASVEHEHTEAWRGEARLKSEMLEGDLRELDSLVKATEDLIGELAAGVAGNEAELEDLRFVRLLKSTQYARAFVELVKYGKEAVNVPPTVKVVTEATPAINKIVPQRLVAAFYAAAAGLVVSILFALVLDTVRQR